MHQSFNLNKAVKLHGNFQLSLILSGDFRHPRDDATDPGQLAMAQQKMQPAFCMYSA